MNRIAPLGDVLDAVKRSRWYVVGAGLQRGRAVQDDPKRLPPRALVGPYRRLADRPSRAYSSVQNETTMTAPLPPANDARADCETPLVAPLDPPP